MNAQREPASRSRLLRAVLIGAGSLSVALGVLGIFLPLLPTVPFLLLAAACFARSSPRLHAWLVNHPRLGPWIADFLEGDGIPLKAKCMAIGLMLISGTVSALMVPSPWARGGIALGIGLGCLWILRQKTRPAR